jgi:L,D-peptidoglycan transpeptidase YkuD (ErfK/YbiS/YcfS/YnhG family)
MHLMRQLIVNGLSTRRARVRLAIGTTSVCCSLGRSGRRALKREGDGATPIGTWALVAVFYRADRVARPRTVLPVRALRPSDGWCDAVGDRNYNRLVCHPYPASAESLWRQDLIYDLIVVLSHNRVPRIQGAGSAIFMHLARPGFTPTAGCIALGERDLRLILARSSERTRLKILG